MQSLYAVLLLSVCASVTVAEVCQRFKPCTRIYVPVCGSDGQTYANECQLCQKQIESPNLFLKYRGLCSDVAEVKQVCDKNTACPRIYTPVCGSNGQTYNNECELCVAQSEIPNLTARHRGLCTMSEAEKVNVDYNQVCDRDTVCSRIYMPVCGSDGQTYSNDCTLCIAQYQIPNLNVKHRGLCTPAESAKVNVDYNEVCDRDTVCSRIFMPICGSDGQTYSNDCQLCVAQYQIPNLNVKHRGLCTPAESSKVNVDYSINQICDRHTACSKMYIPVCGSDGKTYSNECELCVQQVDKPNLKLRSQGLCEN